MTTSALAAAVDTYKALGHATRLRILAMLARRELCVCQLTAVVGLAVSTVSAHLTELRRAGLVAERKDGRWVRYRLAEGPGKVALLGEVTARVAGDPEIVADAHVLRQLRGVPLVELCRVGLDLGRVGIVRSERRKPWPEP